ncbi:MAG: PocR ligand-binding domain-containing protein [Lachnospiraceae bacterium]|nr:PocR ligand-binding domain-containing protein [Lachnospiraceae bacterium]
MNNLDLSLNKESLLELMQNFNLLTGIKIALFDSSGEEILSYPSAHCPFCALIRSQAKTEVYCKESNSKSFKRCQSTKKLQIFHCHAGLVETTAPLIDNNIVIGYVMFGQITDIADNDKVQDHLNRILNEYGLQNELRSDPKYLYNVTFKTQEQIEAAARILEACTFYVLLKDMVTLQRKTFIENFNRFLLEHLNEDLSIERLTGEFHVSKNILYASCSRYLSTGIAEHIKNLRIEESKRLLAETDLSVNEISERVGFNDYNYFCRVFKKSAGIPAKRYRKSYMDE